VQVKLLNRGSDAYKHDIYGDFITIERIIDRQGAGGFRLLNSENVCKSRDRKDIEVMLDLFNIQVENPVAVLDQEQSKKFLKGKDEDKWEFFCKATELERLDNSYNGIMMSIGEMEEQERAVERTLKGEGDEVKELQKQWDECQALKRYENKLTELNISRLWAGVREYEDNYENLKETLDSKIAQVAKQQKKLEDASARPEEGEQSAEEYNATLKRLTEEAKEATARKNELAEEHKLKKKPMKSLERKKEAVARELSSAKKSSKSARKRLDDARAEQAQKIGMKDKNINALVTKQQKAEAELTRIEVELRNGDAELPKVCEEYDDSKAKLEPIEGNKSECVKRMRQIQQQMKALEGKDDNARLAMFSPNTPRLAAKIQSAKPGTFKGRIIGPVGIHLKVKPSKANWAKLAEVALTPSILGAFICERKEDTTTLSKIREAVNCRPNECRVYQQSVHQRYRPPNLPVNTSDIESIVSVLDIEDDLVFNFIVDQAQGDVKALAKNKVVSEQHLLIDRNGKYSIKGDQMKQVYFGPNGDFWQTYRGNISIVSNELSPKLVLGTDQKQAKAMFRQQIAMVQEELDEIEQKLAAEKENNIRLKRLWNTMTKKSKENTRRQEDLGRELRDLKEEAIQLDDLELDTTEMEEDIKDHEKNVADCQSKIRDVETEIEELSPEVAELERKLEEEEARNRKVLEELDAAEKEVEALEKRKAATEANKDKLQRKLEAATEDKEKVEEEVNILRDRYLKADRKARLRVYQNELEAKKAREENDENENPDEEIDFDTVDLDHIRPERSKKNSQYFGEQIKIAEANLEKERKKRQLSEDDALVIHKKLQDATKKLAKKTRSLETLQRNKEALQTDVRMRRKRFKYFRKHIMKLTNNTFDEMLNKKGSSGQINFDTENKSLNLIVQKDNKDEMSQTKDVKALSGGERSFTTIALLLALGENLETPFRVFDEFDVFLDSVARKIALDTLVSTSLALEHRQFIYITPQDLSSLKPHSKLKLFKMSAPERGQMTLVENFS